MNTRVTTSKGVVLDASAVLAFLNKETGKELVLSYLGETCCFCTSINWAEIKQKVPVLFPDEPKKRTYLTEGLRTVFQIKIGPVTGLDAEWAANAWPANHKEWTNGGLKLSLADRICLAVAARLGVPAVTTDREWGNSGDGYNVIQIR